MMYWYHPTTTAVIDDDKDFLKIFNQHLELPNCILFSSPQNAINSLLNEKHLNRIQARTVKSATTTEDINSSIPEQYAFRVNFRELHEEIYSPQRFHDISVLIVDYHMGEINGIDVCEQLADHPAKKILLTGGADKEQIAIEAFNKGIIHRFISKSDIRFPSQLKQAVNILKETYFKEATNALVPNLSSSSIQLLKNPAFMNFIRSIQLKINAVEYYLLDASGSMLFLNESGAISWLVIKSENELKDYEQIAKDADGSTNLINLIKEHKKIPFFFSEEDYQQPISNWENYFYPANVLPGINGYYYSLIQQSIHVDKEKIFPYVKHHTRVIAE